MANRPSIILIDDHALVRRGLAALLNQSKRFKVVAEGTNGEEALELARTVPADVMLLDLAMPRLNGLEVVSRLADRPDRLRLLIVSMYDDAAFVARALREGADGYILKQALEDDLFRALDAVLAGQIYLCPLIERKRMQGMELSDSDITEREREVLQLIADGLTTAEVAERLFISPHTATRHRANLMRKLNVHNPAELLRAAAARGLIILPQRTD
ncbi:MAG: response regulator transcription factor [Gemmataceae bacterium]|nr:response regulator transcription factor [Gemmata sp.]MDW8196974.1 response regulator transcription factor [Gemmataceae bacterium]